MTSENPIIEESARDWMNRDADGSLDEERRRITAEVEERYRVRLERAGFLRRLVLLWQKNQELAQELRKLEPGPYSLGLNA